MAVPTPRIVRGGVRQEHTLKLCYLISLVLFSVVKLILTITIVIHLTLSAPTANLTIAPKAALERSYMHFFCKVTGFPPPNITWYKNDSAIRRLPWFTRLPVAGGEYLRLGSMRWYRHDGVYHCRASNEVGTATSKKSSLIVYKGSIGVIFCAHKQSSFSGAGLVLFWGVEAQNYVSGYIEFINLCHKTLQIRKNKLKY